ncbi:hypothetical protein [Plantactinospora veratri]
MLLRRCGAMLLAVASVLVLAAPAAAAPIRFRRRATRGSGW